MVSIESDPFGSHPPPGNALAPERKVGCGFTESHAPSAHDSHRMASGVGRSWLDGEMGKGCLFFLYL